MSDQDPDSVLSPEDEAGMGELLRRPAVKKKRRVPLSSETPAAAAPVTEGTAPVVGGGARVLDLLSRYNPSLLNEVPANPSPIEALRPGGSASSGASAIDLIARVNKGFQNSPGITVEQPLKPELAGPAVQEQESRDEGHAAPESGPGPALQEGSVAADVAVGLAPEPAVESVEVRPDIPGTNNGAPVSADAVATDHVAEVGALSENLQAPSSAREAIPVGTTATTLVTPPQGDTNQEANATLGTGTQDSPVATGDIQSENSTPLAAETDLALQAAPLSPGSVPVADAGIVETGAAAPVEPAAAVPAEAVIESAPIVAGKLLDPDADPILAQVKPQPIFVPNPVIAAAEQPQLILPPTPQVVVAAPHVQTPKKGNTEREGQGYHYIFEREPLRIDRPTMDHILRWGANNDVSDTFFYSGQPVIGERYGRLVRLTRRSLEIDEVQELLNSWQKSNTALLQRGEDVNLRHVFAHGRDERYAFRVCATACNTLQPGAIGVEIVCRCIPWKTPTIADIFLEDEILRGSFPQDGLVLVTGPTGSGKSTLLAAILREAITAGRLGEGQRLITYEEPIEFNLIGVPGQTGMVVQTEIPRDLPDFPAAIKNALRRKPKYILIGESRSAETIHGTCEASDTGHAVFSTVHTKGVVNTIPRMADMFDPRTRWARISKLVESMRMIVHQRLVPDTRGKRVALREYLVFNEGLREHIINSGEEKFFENMTRALEKYGQPLLLDAQKKFEEGKIDKVTLDTLSSQKAKSEVL